MIVKDIVEIALTILKRDDILEKGLFNSESEEELSEEQSKEIVYITRCLNLTYNEIASSYLPLLYEEEIVFIDNEYQLNSLSKSILEVFGLYNLEGEMVKYKLFPTYLKANVKSAKILYSYLPDSLEINDEINLFGGKLMPQVLAYGVLKEFCLINSLYSDSDIWEQKFKNGLGEAVRRKGDVFIKPRGWF